MGRDGTDTNAVDFFSDGSGSGNCCSGNDSSTFDHSATMLDAQLYPSCPAPAGTGGNGTSLGDPGAVQRAARLRDHGSAREPGVLVGQARPPRVREVQAAGRDPGADVLELSKRKALAGCCAMAATALRSRSRARAGSGRRARSTKTTEGRPSATTTTPPDGRERSRRAARSSGVWAADNTDTHNVILKQHPKGVKASDYRSGDAAVQYKYTPSSRSPAPTSSSARITRP